jgi:hypothetical protein
MLGAKVTDLVTELNIQKIIKEQAKYFTFTDGCKLGAGAYLVLALVGIYLTVDFLFICLLI